MATVPTPLDWIANAGVYATAAMLEAGVGDPLTFLMNPPGATVHRGAAQSIPNNTPTAIAFDTEDIDIDAMHSASGTRLTINTPGTYFVSGMIPYDPNATGQREARLVKNGTGSAVPGARTIIPASGSFTVTAVLPSIELPLIVGDFLELVANQTSGGALNTTAANGVFPVLCARWVRL